MQEALRVSSFESKACESMTTSKFPITERRRRSCSAIKPVVTCAGLCRLSHVFIPWLLIPLHNTTGFLFVSFFCFVFSLIRRMWLVCRIPLCTCEYMFFSLIRRMWLSVIFRCALVNIWIPIFRHIYENPFKTHGNRNCLNTSRQDPFVEVCIAMIWIWSE